MNTNITTKFTDESLSQFIREVKEMKYKHTNLRHGMLLGGRIYMSVKDGELTYMNIDGVLKHRKIEDEVLDMFIGQESKRNEVVHCLKNIYIPKKKDGDETIIYDAGFIGCSISEDDFLAITEWLSGKIKSVTDFKLPMRRSLGGSKRVYISPALQDVLQEHIDKKNA